MSEFVSSKPYPLQYQIDDFNQVVGGILEIKAELESWAEWWMAPTLQCVLQQKCYYDFFSNFHQLGTNKSTVCNQIASIDFILDW